MYRLIQTEARDRVDSWLRDIVGNVLQSSAKMAVGEAALWTLLDTLPVAVLVGVDRSCTQIVGNKAAQALLRVPHGANFSQSAPSAERPAFRVYDDGLEMSPDDLPMQRSARTGQRVGRSECEIRFDTGECIFIAGHCIPIVDDDGAICGSLGAFVDVTPQRIEYEHSEVIAREMAHRVKNTVALIQSLAHSTVRSLIGNEEYRKFEQRVLNISAAQDVLGNPRSGADLAELLSRSIRPVFHVLSERVRIAGPDLAVPSDTAVRLSMIFHELATNACKYGALSVDDGQIEVSWTIDVDPHEIRVCLVWRESDGQEAASADRVGYGTTLINRLVKSLPSGQCTREFQAPGLDFTMRWAVRA